MNKRQFGWLIRITFHLTITLGLLLSLFISPQLTHALGMIRYVIPGGAASGSCNSWGTACELRYALTSVAVSGDQIWVKASTYKPTSGTDRSISFTLKNGVAIYGGFNGTETLLSQRNPVTNVTILSGEIGAAGTSDNSFHVVIGSGTNNTAVLDGFTITAGNATNDKGGGMWNYGGSPTLTNLIFSANLSQSGGGLYNENNSNSILTNVTFDTNTATYRGGGVYNDSSSPILANITLTANIAADDGGGIYNGNNSNPVITDVTFSYNESNGTYTNGGGMYNNGSNPTLTNVIFTGNSATSGGGIYNNESSSTLTHVTFSDNSATYQGGGMANSSSNPNLTDVTFNANTASCYGGGMFDQNASSPHLADVIFSSNHAGSSSCNGWGGGIYSNSSNPVLTNVTFSNNSTGDSGGGFYIAYGNPVMMNVTFSNNSAGDSGGGMYNFEGGSTLTNVTFNGNSAIDGGGVNNFYGVGEFTNVLFTSNTANHAGGGIYDFMSSPDLTNVTLSNNSAGYGGGIYRYHYYNSNGSLTNVTFSGNIASNTGGGMYNDDSDPNLTNVTFSGNTATVSTGGMYNTNSNPQIFDSIFWNDGSEIYNNFSTPTLGDSIVMGGCPSSSTCTNIINVNPLLGPLQNNGGYTQTMALGAGSPAIDAGNDATCASTDQRGVTRPQGNHCDIGAYELEMNPHIITGNTGVAGVTLGYTDGIPKTVISQSNGNYSLLVSYNWTGIVTPTHPCFTFTPASKNYSNVIANQTGQNYTPAFIGGSGCADVNVLVGGVNQGRFGIPPQGSTRASFAGLNNGPVKIDSTNAIPLIGAERAIYKVNNVNTSFSELMALPESQLDDTYWLPWYNNVDLDTQLRFGNVSGATATVHVFIGGVEMTSGCTSTPNQVYPYVLTNGSSLRVSCAGKNAGPVQIVSDEHIVAAERVIYKVNGINTSFSELMALPNSQLNTTYWLPWYNNVDLDTQLRFGNVSGSTATIHVYIGGVEISGCTSIPSTPYPYVLANGASIRVSCAGVNNGPVKIEGTGNIVAAERVIYKVNGINTSFSELMALPESQLDDTYWLPWYNNVDLDTQLRFGNVSGATATVRVYIGGVEMTSGCTSTPSLAYPYVLTNGSSIRVSCAGKNAGPVQIVSDENIVAAERVIYKVNNVSTSFSELMALANNLLDDTYWLPWYNNVDLDTQLRFGVP